MSQITCPLAWVCSTWQTYHGQDLVDRVLELARRYQPLHISIVGGEPLVRYRELDVLLPALAAMNIEVQFWSPASRKANSHALA